LDDSAQWLAAVELALLKGRHPCLDTISLRSEVEESESVSSRLPGYGQTVDKKRVLGNHKVDSFKVMTEQNTGGEILRLEISNLFLGKSIMDIENCTSYVSFARMPNHNLI
jgi:hypothetical protein